MCLGIPGEVIAISGEDLERKAKVQFGLLTKEVSLAFLPEAKAGDYVLVHVGVAISVLDPEAALASFAEWERYEVRQ